MRLAELFDLVKRERGSDHIKKWITDCLGTVKPGLKDPIRIEDFTGDIKTRILCLNFIKEIKTNMPGSTVYRKIVLLLEDYLKGRAAKHPAFRIKDFSLFLSKQADDFFCVGAEIKDKPTGFSSITTLQDIIKHNIPDGSAVPIEDINDLNVEEKIEYIKDREARGLPMNSLRTELPLFWCTRSVDITGISRGRTNKADAVRDELGLSSRTSGYLVEFRLSNDYVNAPHKPVFFDSGPNLYFCATWPESEYGKTRRLSDFSPTEWPEAVHKEKEWPSDDVHDIIPLGNLGTLPTCKKSAKEKALKEMWEDLTGRFPEVVEEIRDLYYNRQDD
ncbi:MAG: hypothetical protein L0Y73_06405 [Candidatus Aminicenantes bacterium]|nr:hypothetical protein [Candidatus Aminicenantes bacterium]